MNEKSKPSPFKEPKLTLICCFLLAALHHTTEAIGPPCQYSKQKGYQTADCSDRKLSEVPKTLRPEVEVVDLSSNKIRELKNDTFACCTSIKLLYLQQNSIYEIESHTFYSLTSMTVLDLSTNVLDKMPTNLPSSLQRLYLDENPKLMSFDSESPVLPIAGLTSLEVLHLSHNKLRKFPNFNGSVASLVEINMTGNQFHQISADDLASLCQLRFIYVWNGELFPDIHSNDTQYCECLKLERWITTYGIEIRSFSCKRDKPPAKECLIEYKNLTLATYNSCLSEVSARKLPYKMMIGGGTVVLIVGIFILYLRRRSKQHATKCENTKTRTPACLKNMDSKVMEEKCTNHAFDGRPYRIQHLSMPPTETAV